jgi:hypothetical protein
LEESGFPTAEETREDEEWHRLRNHDHTRGAPS